MGNLSQPSFDIMFDDDTILESTTLKNIIYV